MSQRKYVKRFRCFDLNAAIRAVAFLAVFLYACQGFSVGSQRYCDTSYSFVFNLLKTKVDYERSVEMKETPTKIQQAREKYIWILKRFFADKECYKEAFRNMLAHADYRKSTYVTFCFYPLYVDTIPKYGFVTYQNCLRLLLFNLDRATGKDPELVYDETIIKD